MNRGVIRIVETTRAIRWWIDEQIRNGKSDDQIEAGDVQEHEVDVLAWAQSQVQ
jgi:hypothetical protein